MLSWIHISDLHFGHARNASQRVDQSIVLNELLEDASRLVKHLGTPDLVLLTGDVAYSAKANEYDPAEEWLQKFLDAVGAQRDRLFIVPGNHDVDRAWVSNSYGATAVHTTLRSKPEDLDQLLEKPDELAGCVWPKLGAFCKFAEAFEGNVFKPDAPFCVRKLELQLGTVAVVGLNTVLSSFDNGDAVGNLALGRIQIERALARVPDQALIMVLQHHPPQWLQHSDRQLLGRLLEERPHIIFSGHIHRQGGAVEHSIPSGHTLQLVAGAGHAAAGEGVGHGYYWGQLSVEGLHYYPRSWVQERTSFHDQHTGEAHPARFLEGVGRFKDVHRSQLPPKLSTWLVAGGAQGTTARGASEGPSVVPHAAESATAAEEPRTVPRSHGPTKPRLVLVPDRKHRDEASKVREIELEVFERDKVKIAGVGRARFGLTSGEVHHIVTFMREHDFNVDSSWLGRFVATRQLRKSYPERDASVRSFFLSRYPVTNQTFKAFVEAKKYVTEAEKERQATTWRSFVSTDTAYHPVRCVAFSDALAFCEWLGVRLPTSDEYEWAVRGLEGRLFPWGHEWSFDHCNDVFSVAYKHTAPVNEFENGQTADSGVFGLCGNTYEWVTPNESLGRGVQLLAGGSYRRAAILRGNACCRRQVPAHHCDVDVGFRVAADAV